jgi:hypothetical protein
MPFNADFSGSLLLLLLLLIVCGVGDDATAVEV